MSGEDWTDVSLSLSTATPSLVSLAPQLDELSLTLVRPSPASPGKDALGQTSGLNYEEAKNQLRARAEYGGFHP